MGPCAKCKECPADPKKNAYNHRLDHDDYAGQHLCTACGNAARKAGRPICSHKKWQGRLTKQRGDRTATDEDKAAVRAALLQEHAREKAQRPSPPVTPAASPEKTDPPAAPPTEPPPRQVVQGAPRVPTAAAIPVAGGSGSSVSPGTGAPMAPPVPTDPAPRPPEQDHPTAPPQAPVAIPALAPAPAPDTAQVTVVVHRSSHSQLQECKAREQRERVVKLLSEDKSLQRCDWKDWLGYAQSEDGGGFQYWLFPSIDKPKAAMITSTKAAKVVWVVHWIAALEPGHRWGRKALKSLRADHVFPPGLKTWRVMLIEALDAKKDDHWLCKVYAVTFEPVTRGKWTKRTRDQRNKLVIKSAGGRDKLDDDAIEAIEDFVKRAGEDNYLLTCSSGRACDQLSHDIGLEPTEARQLQPEPKATVPTDGAQSDAGSGAESSSPGSCGYSEAISHLNRNVPGVSFISEEADNACGWRGVARQVLGDPENFDTIKGNIIEFCHTNGLDGMLPHVKKEERLIVFESQTKDTLRGARGTSSRPLEPYVQWVRRPTSWLGELELSVISVRYKRPVLVYSLVPAGEGVAAKCIKYSADGSNEHDCTPDRETQRQAIILGHMAPNGKPLSQANHYSSGKVVDVAADDGPQQSDEREPEPDGGASGDSGGDRTDSSPDNANGPEGGAGEQVSEPEDTGGSVDGSAVDAMLDKLAPLLSRIRLSPTEPEPYIGDRKDGLAHGKGTAIFFDGREYEGEWCEGKPHGRGTETWPSGKRYVGEWREGWPHGRGTRTEPDDSRYVGEWREGIYHGTGILTSPNGAQYEGEWRECLMHGNGTHTRPNGARYEGEWREGLTHGNGTLTCPDGFRYEGEWHEGKPHGKGTVTWPDGAAQYEGDFCEGKIGKPHGKGTVTWPDGAAQYEGDFCEGKINGTGKIIASDGTTIVAIKKWRPVPTGPSKPNKKKNKRRASKDQEALIEQFRKMAESMRVPEMKRMMFEAPAEAKAVLRVSED
eukprot:COSAG02_NODE_2035_length_10040_cov_4.348355_5_plen_995_part_00